MAENTPRIRAFRSNWMGTLVAVGFSQSVAIAGFDFTLPFIPLYLQNDLGVHGLGPTALWSGLIGFGPAIPAAICGPMWGRLADRVGYRAMLLRALCSASALLFLMGLAPSPGILLVLRMIQGALTGTVFASQALVSTTVPRQELARAMGLLQMSVFVGATFGPIGGGAVATLFGFRAAFAGAGFLLALGAVIVFAFVQEPSRTPRLHGETVAAMNRPSLRALLAFPAFAAAVAVTLLVQFATTSMMPALPLYVQALIHTSRGVATDTGWLLAASGLFAAIGSSMAGRLQRRFGLEPLLVAAVLASAILVAPQAFAQSFWGFLVLRASAAGAFGVLFGLVGTWAAVSSPPESRGAAFGLIGAASSLGFGSGPLVGGAIIALFGIRPLFVIAAGILACAPGVMWGLPMIQSAILGRARPSRATHVP